jgi:C-terminal processing protease CtpA/Prc
MDSKFIKKIKQLVKNSIVKKEINFPENADLDTIKKILKQHHHHISITEPKKDKLIKNKMPKINLTNQILTIKFYRYIDNNDNEFYNKYVTFVQNKLETNINKIKGIVIDLTKHSGGWFQPFIEGLSTTILNNTTLFRMTSNNKIENFGWFNVENKKIIRASGDYMGNHINTDLKIAVLVSKKTASSGELCASIFKRNLKNVKIFGEDTNGLLTVNNSYEINEKYMIHLPILYSVTVDKKIQKKEYLTPDVYTDKPTCDAKKWFLT